MNLTRLQQIRRETDQGDTIHLAAHLLEIGRTGYDGLMKLTEPAREMVCAAAVALGEERLKVPRKMAPPTRMRSLRVERKLSLSELARVISAENAVKVPVDVLKRLEESPRPRRDLRPEIVQAIEKTLGYGWEYLTARIEPAKRTYTP